MSDDARSVLTLSAMRAIDLVSIIEVLLVAEHCSFRQAACVLDVRPSAVSRRIRALEDTLGVSLFERHPSGVRVTPAGARFLERARYALLHLDYAIKTAATAGRGESGVIRIGICSSIASGFLRELIQGFRERHGEVSVQISECAFREHVALIRRGRLDVAFVMGTPAVPNCDTEQFWAERAIVVLPCGHALCRRQEIEWEVLRGEHFILRESDPGPALQDCIIKRLADHGHRPSVQRLDVGRETSMHLVALGMGVSITSEATIANSFPGVEFRPIAGDSETIPFSGVWSPKNDNPAFRRFLSLARVQAKTWSTQLNGVIASSWSRTASDLIDRCLVFLVASGQMLDLLT